MNDNITIPKNRDDVFKDGGLFEKAMRLKSYAISQGYEIDEKIINILNSINNKVALGPKKEPNGKSDEKKHEKDLVNGGDNTSTVDTNQTEAGNDISVDDLNALDQAISALTKVTFPVTIDTLSKEKESVEYKKFKNILLWSAFISLMLAGISFYISVEPISGTNVLLGNNLLAIFLGLLGSIVYSLFNILRIIPPQAFNPTDLYSLYARLLLGPLLGWLFYFSFAIDAFKNLETITTTESEISTMLLLVPFIAGYSTKFVISLLEKMMQALEITIGVEDKRDLTIKKSKEKV